jgi:hypothetical protein
MVRVARQQLAGPLDATLGGDNEAMRQKASFRGKDGTLRGQEAELGGRPTKIQGTIQS